MYYYSGSGYTVPTWLKRMYGYRGPRKCVKTSHWPLFVCGRVSSFYLLMLMRRASLPFVFSTHRYLPSILTYVRLTKAMRICCEWANATPPYFYVALYIYIYISVLVSILPCLFSFHRLACLTPFFLFLYSRYSLCLLPT